MNFEHLTSNNCNIRTEETRNFRFLTQIDMLFFCLFSCLYLEACMCERDNSNNYFFSTTRNFQVKVQIYINLYVCKYRGQMDRRSVGMEMFEL